MSRITTLFLLLALSLSALSASILPTSASDTFPQCGLSCTALTNAQTSCESGAAASWQSCFCQSSLITSIKSSGNVCSSCSSDDQATISTWYKNYCSGDGSTATSTTTGATSTATSTSTPAKANTNVSNTEEKKSWWSTHYRWIIMLIVLVIAFSLIGAFGVWLKRRYDARRPNLYHGDSSGALSMTSPPREAAWGPAGEADLAAGSLASSRTNVAKSNAPVPGVRTRLTKVEQGPEV